MRPPHAARGGSEAMNGRRYPMAVVTFIFRFSKRVEFTDLVVVELLTVHTIVEAILNAYLALFLRE